MRRREIVKSSRGFFSLIEILVAITIIIILFVMVMPSYQSAKDHAKFTRWYGYNDLLNNDPDCVVNFNFQAGDGDVVETGSSGCDDADYDADQYRGNIHGGCSWRPGRWPQSKQSIHFNGSDSFIEVTGKDALNFSGSDDFSIIAWVKFDNLEGVKTICSRQNADGTQYSLAVTEDQIIAEIFGQTLTFPTDQLGTGEWAHIVLNYKSDGGQTADCSLLNEFESLCSADEAEDEDEDGDGGTADVTVYLNGKALAAQTMNYNGYEPADRGGSLIIGASLDAGGDPQNLLFGNLDEFVLCKRSFSAGEIMAHHDMGLTQ